MNSKRVKKKMKKKTIDLEKLMEIAFKCPFSRYHDTNYATYGDLLVFLLAGKTYIPAKFVKKTIKNLEEDGEMECAVEIAERLGKKREVVKIYERNREFSKAANYILEENIFPIERVIYNYEKDNENDKAILIAKATGMREKSISKLKTFNLLTNPDSSFEKFIDNLFDIKSWRKLRQRTIDKRKYKSESGYIYKIKKILTNFKGLDIILERKDEFYVDNKKEEKQKHSHYIFRVSKKNELYLLTSYLIEQEEDRIKDLFEHLNKSITKVY